MRGIQEGDERPAVGRAAPAHRRAARSRAGDWTAGYAEGKRAFDAWSDTYAGANAYLDAISEGLPLGHSWVDGFKTGWAVASDG
jgi:hypothetical protein